MRVALTEKPIDLAALVSEAANPRHGAIATFLGVVRNTNKGRAVSGIDYTAYDEMAEREMEAIAEEAVTRFGTPSVFAVHRVGFLAVGEASVAIVVAHAQRTEAIEGMRYVIEQLKRRVPIWKCEHYTDGSREWVHAGTGAPGK